MHAGCISLTFRLHVGQMGHDCCVQVDALRERLMSVTYRLHVAYISVAMQVDALRERLDQRRPLGRGGLRFGR